MRKAKGRRAVRRSMRECYRETPAGRVLQWLVYHISEDDSQFLLAFYFNLVTVWLMGERMNSRMVYAFCCAQFFLWLTHWGCGKIQQSEAGEGYTFGEFFLFRLQTAILAVSAAVLYVLARGYWGFMGELLLLLAFSEILEGIADVYETELRRQGKKDLAGQALGYRMGLSMLSYTVMLILTRDLVQSLTVMLVIQLMCVAVLDVREAGRVPAFQWFVRQGYRRQIFRLALPMMFYALADLLLLNYAKLALYRVVGGASLTRFQAIFLLGQIVFLLASLFTRVSFEKLCPQIAIGSSRNWPIGATWKTIGFSLGLIAALAIEGALIGPLINQLLYSSDTHYLQTAYAQILLGGGFGALASFLKHVLQNLKYRRAILAVYGLTICFLIPVSGYLVRRWGIQGASLAYMLGYLVLSLLLAAVFFYETWKRRRAASVQG